MDNSSLAGYNLATSINTVQDGGIVFKPIVDNMLRTVHSKPQITVSISNTMSKCASTCDYDWLSSQTPIVQTIDSSSLKKQIF